MGVGWGLGAKERENKGGGNRDGKKRLVNFLLGGAPRRTGK